MDANKSEDLNEKSINESINVSPYQKEKKIGKESQINLE